MSEARKLIEDLLEFEQINEKFNADFVREIKEKGEKFGSLTPRQVDAIRSIHSKWRVQDKLAKHRQQQQQQQQQQQPEQEDAEQHEAGNVAKQSKDEGIPF